MYYYVIAEEKIEVSIEKCGYFCDTRFLEYLSENKKFGKKTIRIKKQEKINQEARGVYREANVNLFERQKKLAKIFSEIKKFVHFSDIPPISFDYYVIGVFFDINNLNSTFEKFKICLLKNNTYSKKYLTKKFDDDIIFDMKIDQNSLFLKKIFKSNVIFNFNTEEKKFLYRLMFINSMFNPFFCLLLLQNFLKYPFVKLKSKNNIFITHDQEIEFFSYAPDGSKNKIEHVFECVLFTLIQNCYYSLY